VREENKRERESCNGSSLAAIAAAATAAALLPLQLLQQQCVRAGSRVEWM